MQLGKLFIPLVLAGLGACLTTYPPDVSSFPDFSQPAPLEMMYVDLSASELRSSQYSNTSLIVLPENYHLKNPSANYTVNARAKNELLCDTSAGSPLAYNVWDNGNFLQQNLNREWCCTNYQWCRNIRASESYGKPAAASDVCDWVHDPPAPGQICTRCCTAGTANLWIYSKCTKEYNGKKLAGGRVRLDGTRLEVNAYIPSKV